MAIELTVDISKLSLSNTEVSQSNSSSTQRISSPVPNESSQQFDSCSFYSTVPNDHPRCSCPYNHSSMQIRDLDEEHYQWELQEDQYQWELQEEQYQWALQEERDQWQLQDERHQWALREQLEWARYNMDPYYPYYNQTEQLPPAPVEQAEVVESEEEHRNSVPSGIRAIWQMLRDDEEEEESCDQNNNNNDNVGNNNGGNL
jgi:hypothetical protein